MGLTKNDINTQPPLDNANTTNVANNEDDLHELFDALYL